MYVRDWMQAPAVLLIADVSLPAALKHLERLRATHVVIVHHGKVVGVASRPELREAVGADSSFRLHPLNYLGDLPTGPAHPVSPFEPLERAARTMLEFEVPVVPIVDEGRVVGLLRESDVLRAFTEILGAEESGARVVFDAPREADLLATLRTRSRGLDIRSVAAHPKPGGGWEAVMRLRGKDRPTPQGAAS